MKNLSLNIGNLVILKNKLEYRSGYMTSKELIEQYNEYIYKKTKGLRKDSKIALEEIVISMKKNSDTIDDFLY